LSTVAF